jgi:hypothetical protein
MYVCVVCVSEWFVRVCGVFVVCVWCVRARVYVWYVYVRLRAGVCGVCVVCKCLCVLCAW